MVLPFLIYTKDSKSLEKNEGVIPLKNAFKILKTDILNIIKNPAAIIVIAAVCFLPSLYAWLNIAASWDPYANTEGVTVAIVSEDKGAEVQGEFMDVGDEVINSLKKNDNLGWRFVSKEEAMKGVEHGDYYAAIIIPENFTEKLLSVTTDTIEKPNLDYYINEKINAISPKVTNSGATAIVENIHNHFVEEVNKSVLEVFNEFGLELEANYVNIEKVRETVFLLEDELPNIFSQLKKADESLGFVDESITKVTDTLEKVDEIDQRAIEVNQELLTKLNTQEEKIDETLDVIIGYLQGAQELFKQVPEITQEIADKGETFDQLVLTLEERKQGIDNVSIRLGEIQDFLLEQDQNLKESSKIKEIQDSVQQNIDDLNKLKTDLEQMLENIQGEESPGQTAAKELQDQANKLQQDINGAMKQTSDAIQNTITQAENNQEISDQTAQELQMIQDTINNAQKELDTQVQEAIDNFANQAANPEQAVEQWKTIIERLETNITVLQDIQTVMDQLQEAIQSDVIQDEAKRMTEIQEKLDQTNQKIDEVITGIETAKNRSGDALTQINEKAVEMEQGLNEIIDFVDQDLRTKFKDVAGQAKNILEQTATVFNDISEKIPVVREALEKGKEMTHDGQEKLALVNEHFPEASEVIRQLADKIRELEEKGDLDELIKILKTDPTEVSEFLADPIVLDEHRLYAIPNYGSAMNPFYTTLALWVGGLILVSSLKADIENKQRFRSHEAYLGRLFTFGGIAFVQAFIVTIGDLLIMKTYVANPIIFILLGIFISLAFVTIIYTLVSVFGNTGKVIAIILMVMQLGGSGGTFPIQMAPAFFQKIHGFLPFTHAITLLREAVGGVVWGVVWLHILYLVIYMIIFLLLGLLLKQFFNRSSDKFMEKAKKSKIVI